MEPGSRTSKGVRGTTIGLIAVPIVFVLVLVLLWSRNFFQFDGTDVSAKIVGTSLTVGGGLIATMVTLIGLILKQSLEQRNADLKEEADKRLALDAERNRALQEDAERRLKLEAAIRAVALLATATGTDTNITQRTGALFSLAHLGSIDVAIDLVALMRPKDLIGPNSTATLLDLGLRSDNPDVQEKASEFMRDHSDLLFDADGFCWPNCMILSWPMNLSFLSRDNALKGLIGGLLSRPQSDWDEGSIDGCFANLVVAFRTEQDVRLKASIVLFLKELLKRYGPGDSLYLPTENLWIAEVGQEIAQFDADAASIGAQALAKSLENWVGKKLGGQENGE